MPDKERYAQDKLEVGDLARDFEKQVLGVGSRAGSQVRRTCEALCMKARDARSNRC